MGRSTPSSDAPQFSVAEMIENGMIVIIDVPEPEERLGDVTRIVDKPNSNYHADVRLPSSPGRAGDEK
jgi:hypothetical protein